MLENWYYENQVNQVKIRWIKEIKGTQKKVRGSKAIFMCGIEVLWLTGFQKGNVYDGKLTFCKSGALRGYPYRILNTGKTYLKLVQILLLEYYLRDIFCLQMYALVATNHISYAIGVNFIGSLECKQTSVE